MTVDLSVIVAVYNEDPRNLRTLLERLDQAISPGKVSYEVVFVNDGSQPPTSKALREITSEFSYIKLVELSRNFGQQAAISAGIDHSSGLAVVNIDSDCQDPPEMIPQMIEKWREGYEVVYAQRSTRRDRVTKRLSAYIFYRMLGSVSSVDIPWDTGDFRLMDRKVVTALQNLPEKTRFLRGLVPWLGFKQVGIAIDRDARNVGESTYTLRKLLRLAMEGLLSFSVTPLYVLPVMGAIIVLLATIALAAWLIFGSAGQANAITAVLVFAVIALAGFQIISTGLVGVYLTKVLDEVRARPTYVVSERLGLPFASNAPELSSNLDINAVVTGRSRVTPTERNG